MKKLQPFKIYLFIYVIFFSACAQVKTGEPLPLAIMPPTVYQGSAAFLTYLIIYEMKIDEIL